MPAMSGFGSLIVLQVMFQDIYLRYRAMMKPSLTIEDVVKDRNEQNKFRARLGENYSCRARLSGTVDLVGNPSQCLTLPQLQCSNKNTKLNFTASNLMKIRG